MPNSLLALNCGSSSFKFKLYSSDLAQVYSEGQASALGTDDATLAIQSNKTSIKGETHHQVFKEVLDALREQYPGLQITTVAHRIVHGGPQTEPVVITAEHQEGLKTMDELSSFAPLHNHYAVLVVRAALHLIPEARNVLCFDTLFHKTLPAPAYTYAIPQPERAPPVPLRRYGFHGLSYASILSNLASHLDRRPEQLSLVVCHLGSGASMCCIKDGKSIDTTMGVTPLEGLSGGTRSGSIDPTLIFHLFPDASEQVEASPGIKLAKGELLLNKSSGFKAMAGTTDFRLISERAANGSEKDKLAIDVFVHNILRYLGAYLLALKNKPDAIVFSGGIGEKSAGLRQQVIEAVDYLGVKLDQDANAKDSKDLCHCISTQDSSLAVYRVFTDEEIECARLAQNV